MKKLGSLLKASLRWAILGGTLFYLVKVLKDHWQEVIKLSITDIGWLSLTVGLVITLIAHICGSWVWILILKSLGQPVKQRWAIQIYLKTNIAKYLPGNVWHFYGRISALSSVGSSLKIATLSVLLEPLLLAAAALAIALTGSKIGPIGQTIGWQLLSLTVILIVIHPRFLNPMIQLLGRFKKKHRDSETLRLKSYPLLPLLAALGFLGLRGLGFITTLMCLMPVHLSQIPQIMSSFSLAWFLGLVLPGAPGGIGVFEATILNLLQHNFNVVSLLGILALFRLVSLLAELNGAVLAFLSEKWPPQKRVV
jgi:hypothetical protein